MSGASSGPAEFHIRPLNRRARLGVEEVEVVRVDRELGEETGKMDDMLREVAVFYEREVEFDLKNLTAKIETILISVVAVMVLILALGIFTPMWDLLSAYKNGK